MQSSLQKLFFQHIKSLVPPHMSLVDEVADLLEISNDSAYRRIRSEKPIDLEEIQKLCGHFKISMDQLLNLQSDAFIFLGNLKGNTMKPVPLRIRMMLICFTLKLKIL